MCHITGIGAVLEKQPDVRMAVLARGEDRIIALAATLLPWIGSRFIDPPRLLISSSSTSYGSDIVPGYLLSADAARGGPRSVPRAWSSGRAGARSRPAGSIDRGCSRTAVAAPTASRGRRRAPRRETMGCSIRPRARHCLCS